VDFKLAILVFKALHGIAPAPIWQRNGLPTRCDSRHSKHAWTVRTSTAYEYIRYSYAVVQLIQAHVLAIVLLLEQFAGTAATAGSKPCATAIDASFCGLLTYLDCCRLLALRTRTSCRRTGRALLKMSQA